MENKVNTKFFGEIIKNLPKIILLERFGLIHLVLRKIRDFFENIIFEGFKNYIKLPKVRIYWWGKINTKNFGDELNPYLIRRISHTIPILCSKHSFKDYYAITGSILGLTNENIIVWGSGIKSRYQVIKKPKKILAVRGPITRQRLLELDIDCPEIYGDPALLLPEVYKSKSKKKYELGIIPHFVDFKKVKKDFSKISDIIIINMLKPIEEVIDNICKCKRTISSSLHGLIVSHSYNIPSLWAEFSKNLSGDNCKFRDYFLSVDIKPYEPINLIDNDFNYDYILNQFSEDYQIPKIDILPLKKSSPFKLRKSLMF